jgi:hypothetical protein
MYFQGLYLKCKPIFFNVNFVGLHVNFLVYMGVVAWIPAGPDKLRQIQRPDTTPPMPNKHNDSRRHHIPKMKFQVRNWREYDAGLRRRGSLTLWVTDEAMADWQAAPRRTPGGQPCYSDLAIETGLMLHLAFHLPLRQTEGLMASILEMNTSY